MAVNQNRWAMCGVCGLTYQVLYVWKDKIVWYLILDILVSTGRPRVLVYILDVVQGNLVSL